MDNTRNALIMEDLTNVPCDLRFVGATKRYDDFTLHEVSFGVPTGSVVGLIGRNGAGKTTLMKAALGVIALDGGSVEMYGSDVANLSPNELTAIKNRIGYVSAVMAFPSEMSVSDVSHLYSLAYATFDDGEFVRLCERFGLDKPSRKVKDLSRGMGMKLQLACVLACGTDMLVLDEPTAGLDPIVRDEVLEVLYEWSRGAGRSVFISSHITSDLDYLADHLVMIEEGAIALACSREQVKAMGIVHLDEDGAACVRTDPSLPHGTMRMLRRGHNTDVLVPNMASHSAAFSGAHIGSASIDEVMTLVARGEVV